MHFVNPPFCQVLANRCHAPANAYVHALRCFSRPLQRRIQTVGNKVKRRTAFDLKRGPRMMRQHKHRGVVGRRVTPPSFPGVIRPGPAHRPKHVASQDEGPDILKRPQRHVVVDARRSATLTMHLPEDVSLKKPRKDFRAAHAQGVVDVLPWSRAEAVNGNGECSHSYFAHVVICMICSNVPDVPAGCPMLNSDAYARSRNPEHHWRRIPKRKE